MDKITSTFNYKREEAQNPYTGFMSFQHFRGEKLYSDIEVRPENNRTETERVECYPPSPDAMENGREEGYYPDTTIVYIRILWKEFEPERGVYNYDFVDRILDEAKAHNQTLIFRLMAHSTRACDDVPEWLKSMIPCPERPDGMRVKDSPTEAGVEELEIEGKEIRREADSAVTTKDRMRLVFTNKVIWMVAIANFFVYIIRFGFLDWGPTFLKQFKGIPVSKGGLMIIAFELAAVVGTIFAGWATDKWFKGRGVRTCVLCMLFASLFAFGFWFLPQGAPIWQATLLLMGAGFCIYGPQALIGIIVANQATNEAAAMANGFAGIMGYLSTLVSGVGIAYMKETFGWGAALFTIAAMALVGMVIMLFAWNAKANGYKNA